MAALAENTAVENDIRFVNNDPLTEGYLLAALFDPFIICSPKKHTTVYLGVPDTSVLNEEIEGISARGPYNYQKEAIEFSSARAGRRFLYMAGYHLRLKVSTAWKILAVCAELPAVVAKPGSAVFAFHPAVFIRHYLNMMEPDITADITDLLIRAILIARGAERELDNNDLRRDFHALGISAMMVEELCSISGRQWNAKEMLLILEKAAEEYVQDNFDSARRRLGECYQILEKKRKETAPVPVYIIDIPHGGVLFEEEGYAEYDWPEAAAKLFRLYLNWTERFGYRFAPDIGAGTLSNFALLYPETVNRMKKAWQEGRMEFVNGTYSQPYLQLLKSWDQEKQFETGLEIFKELFNRRPTTYAAQEIALHPALPGMLKNFGYKYVIHRSMNAGDAPINENTLVDWRGADGVAIRALPSHAGKSEKAGADIYRRLPILIWEVTKSKLPIAVFTNFVDQTFPGVYKEEVVRAGQYSRLWGEFVIPEQFFDITSGLSAPGVCYNLDHYDYYTAIPPDNYHRYETGGQLTILEHLYQGSLKLQEDETKGVLKTEELLSLLNAEAHDVYLLPYFKRGAYMELYMTDYLGPRYMVTSDAPRGVRHYLKDAAGIPEKVLGFPPVVFTESESRNNIILSKEVEAEIDRITGQITRINEVSLSLGKISFRGSCLKETKITSKDGRLIVTGWLSGFGRITLNYALSKEKVFCIIRADMTENWKPDCKTDYWDDCVCLMHQRPSDSVVLRHCSGVVEETSLPEFFSPEFACMQSGKIEIKFVHGGNIFFRQTSGTLQNRLWSYNEWAESFWWGVDVKVKKYIQTPRTKD